MPSWGMGRDPDTRDSVRKMESQMHKDGAELSMERLPLDEGRLEDERRRGRFGRRRADRVETELSSTGVATIEQAALTPPEAEAEIREAESARAVRRRDAIYRRCLATAD